jgi:hypothetical protein
VLKYTLASFFPEEPPKEENDTRTDSLLPLGWHTINHFHPAEDVSLLKWGYCQVHLKFLGDSIPNCFSKITFSE